MKKLIAAIVVCFGAVLPITPLQAAPRSKDPVNFANRKYGQFSPGDTFNLKITNVNIISTSGKIPKGIPKFKKGQSIKFTIGTKGQLNGPGFSVDFLSNTGGIHNYLDPASPYKLNSSARVTNGKRRPTAAVVTFNLVVVTGSISDFGSYQVAYTF